MIIAIITITPISRITRINHIMHIKIQIRLIMLIRSMITHLVITEEVTEVNIVIAFMNLIDIIIKS